jgi:hypothetical protein
VVKFSDMQKHASNWLDEIVANHHLYRGQFVVHDEHKVYFSAPTLTDADAWKKAADSRFYTSKLHCFYVGKNFLNRYFPSVKVHA